MLETEQTNTIKAPQNDGENRRGRGALVFFIAIVVLAGLWLRSHRANSNAGATTNSGGIFGGGDLQVISEPAGASVLINGRLAGATPVSVPGLPAGTYQVRLEKSGCKPLTRSLDYSGGNSAITEKLDPLPTGGITVEVKPDGAEVLLNGEVIGQTPLKQDHVTAGTYELIVRKTNFEPYSTRIEIPPGEMLVYSDFELKDKIFAMMESYVKSEPQRLAHYIDLGHYLFVNDRINESVDVFAQGMEVMQTPLDFNGQGYTGKDNMTPAEIELEQRLRKEDESRFLKELEKHRNWPRKDTKTFRAKLDQAQDLISRKAVTSWSWAETSARLNIRNRNYEKAAQIYVDHIAASPASPDLPKAYTALIEVYLMQRDAARAKDAFDKFYKLHEANGEALCTCGSTIYVYYDRMTGAGRTTVLEMSEKALRRGLELAKDNSAKSLAMFNLGNVLNFAAQPNEAAMFFEQSIAISPDDATKEERSLYLADALRRTGRLEDSRNLYSKLATSERAAIRERAKTGLIYVAADTAKKKTK